MFKGMCEGNVRLAMRRITWLVVAVAACSSAASLFLWREIAFLQASVRSVEMRLTGRPWEEAESLFDGELKKSGSFHYDGRTWTVAYFPSGANSVDFLIIIDENGLISATSSGKNLQSGPLLTKAYESLR